MVNMKNFYAVTGSPQSALVNITGIQLARDFYGLPSRTMAGLTDAKRVDFQAGEIVPMIVPASYHYPHEHPHVGRSHPQRAAQNIGQYDGHWQGNGRPPQNIRHGIMI